MDATNLQLSIPIDLSDNSENTYRCLPHNIRHLCRQQGFSVAVRAELQNAFLDGELNHEAESFLKSCAAEFDGIVCHMPFMGLSTGCYEPAIREASFDLLEKCVVSLHNWDVELFVTHLNFNFFVDKHNGWLRRSTEWWRRFLNACGGSFVLENTMERSCDIFVELLNAVNSDRLNACIDVGHLNCCALNVADWVNALKEKVVYYHLSDNNGYKPGVPFYSIDQHLQTGNGNVDWPSFLKVSGALRRVSACIEVRESDVINSISVLLKILRSVQ